MDPVDARVNAKVGFIEMIVDFLTVKETDSFFVKFLRRLFTLCNWYCRSCSLCNHFFSTRSK